MEHVLDWLKAEIKETKNDIKELKSEMFNLMNEGKYSKHAMANNTLDILEFKLKIYENKLAEIEG